MSLRFLCLVVCAVGAAVPAPANEELCAWLIAQRGEAHAIPGFRTDRLLTRAAQAKVKGRGDGVVIGAHLADIEAGSPTILYAEETRGAEAVARRIAAIGNGLRPPPERGPLWRDARTSEERLAATYMQLGWAAIFWGIHLGAYYLRDGGPPEFSANAFAQNIVIYLLGAAYWYWDHRPRWEPTPVPPGPVPHPVVAGWQRHLETLREAVISASAMRVPRRWIDPEATGDFLIQFLSVLVRGEDGEPVLLLSVRAPELAPRPAPPVGVEGNPPPLSRGSRKPGSRAERLLEYQRRRQALEEGRRGDTESSLSADQPASSPDDPTPSDLSDPEVAGMLAGHVLDAGVLRTVHDGLVGFANRTERQVILDTIARLREGNSAVDITQLVPIGEIYELRPRGHLSAYRLFLGFRQGRFIVVGDCRLDADHMDSLSQAREAAKAAWRAAPGA